MRLHVLLWIPAILAVFSSSIYAAPPNPSEYPVKDKLPTANPAWSTHILKGLPNTPPNPKPMTTFDFSKDVTRCRDNHVWGLSFDDGPAPFTDHLLAELDKRSVKASFFVVGSRVLERPDVLLRTYQAGHHIAMHTWSHPHLTTVSSNQIIAEVVYTAMIIKQVIGVTPRFIRAPYGDIDTRVRTILQRMGLIIAAWNEDSGDAGGVKTVAQRFLARANAGIVPIISLQHDLFVESERQAPGAMDAILSGRGKYKIQAVDTCIGESPYDEGFWSRLDGTKGSEPTANENTAGAVAGGTEGRAESATQPTTSTENPHQSTSASNTSKSSTIAIAPFMAKSVFSLLLSALLIFSV
ncbi:hypothetical protein BDV3_005099 [Batrachochytrium dendrobatidis]